MIAYCGIELEVIAILRFWF